ncbi:FAD binding domain-containing protein [Bordetella genomosp. 13]|uniref:FAD binding domain-containing protein n=1 Tax=Bordetella genomosp. 13 TaxID=463040 RepID=UPI00119EA58E|nr:FAD binding domain-containing protein [Bordetella genomosp. 13]
MKLPYFDYRAPSTLDQALEALAALGTDAKVLAGGQSLLPAMRYGLARPHVLLDLRRIAELREREAAASGWRIGAMATHADLAHASADTPLARLLAAHAAQIAFPAVRTRGTVGGSLVHADPAGDWPLLFCALQARVQLRSLRGSRELPLDAFITGPLTSDAQFDELLVSVGIDADAAGLTAWGRSKLMHRAGEYAASSAVVLRRADGQWSCWLGGPPPAPRALPACAALLADPATPRPRLMECAVDEVARAYPDDTPAAVHRHAANLLRACDQALERHDA